MSPAPVRLALLGLGNMGLAHLDILTALPAQVQVTALADGHAPFLARAGERVPAAARYLDPLACVQSADVDAVMVVTADDTHHRLVAAAVARGLPVFCEKPLTTSSALSWELVAAERARGRRLVQVGFMRRYDPGYRALHQRLASGRAGAPVLISGRHHNPAAVNDFDARELITSSASHDIDLFRWFCDDDVAEVSARTHADPTGATVMVALTLTSRSGVIGVVEVGRGPGLRYDIGFDVVAGRAALSLDEVTAGPGRLVTDDWFARFADAYRAQDQAWLAGLAGDGADSPGAGAYDGYAVNAVIDAALSALHSGRPQPVELRER